MWQALLARLGQSAAGAARAARSAAMVVTQVAANRPGGMLGLAREAVGASNGRVSSLGAVGSALGGVGSGAVNGAMVGAQVGGPWGAAAGAVAGASIELVALPGRLKDLGQAVLESTRHFSQLNGSMAISYAQLDIDRYHRNVAMARGTADSTRALTKSQSRLEDALQPANQLMTNVGNRLLSVLEDAVSTVVETTNNIFTIIRETIPGAAQLLDAINGPNRNERQPFLQMLDELGRRADARRNQPLPRAQDRRRRN